MKTKGTYKKRPYIYHGPHSASRQPTFPKHYREEKNLKSPVQMAASRAKVLWGSNNTEQGVSPTKFIQDNSWGKVFQHYTELLTDFTIKAGSKKMILSSSVAKLFASSSSSSSSSSGGRDQGRSYKLSEDLLLKKYRYKLA